MDWGSIAIYLALEILSRQASLYALTLRIFGKRSIVLLVDLIKEIQDCSVGFGDGVACLIAVIRANTSMSLRFNAQLG